MEAKRTTCRRCDALLLLMQEDGRWSLRCPSDGGFINLTPGKHTLPVSYSDDCHQRATNPKAFGLTDEQGDAYEAAAALKRAYLQACSATTGTPAASAS